MAILSTRTSRRLLATLVMVGPTFGLLAIGWGFYDSHRSQRAWEKHRAAAVARGVQYDFTRFAPAPVPDEENFAATPFFRELFAADEAKRKEMTDRLKLGPANGETEPPPDDRLYGNWLQGERFDAAAWEVYLGTSDLLEHLRSHEALLDEISLSAARPTAVFPIEYDQLGALSLPHALPLLRLAKLYRLRSKAFLEAGLPEKARDDLLTLFRLTRHSGNRDPIMIMSLVQSTLFSFAMDVYREGLASRQWSNATLLQIQGELQAFDFLSVGEKAYHGERASYISQVELILRFPSDARVKLQPREDEVYQKIARTQGSQAWLYRSLHNGDRFFEKYLLGSLDPAARRVTPEKEEARQRWYDAAIKNPDAAQFLILSYSPPLSRTAERFAFSQTLADLGTLAAALERYHQQHGDYPATLAALVPSYLDKLPHDLVTGDPLHYRPTGNGRFLLYSTGWNGTDDGGTMAKDGTGDWVWPQPNESNQPES